MNLRSAKVLLPRQSVGWPTYSAIALWLTAIAASGWALAEYQFTTLDSPLAKFADRWPAGSQLPRRPNHSTLLLFLHPKCPCSRASLGELERLFGSVQGRIDDTLDFVVDATIPAECGEDWLNTDTLQHAKQIANAQIHFDRGGGEAMAFGATTSGFVMLFDENGSRQFAGGVTESRGHEGESAGGYSLRRILCHEIDSAEIAPAFGCRLCLPEAGCPSEASGTFGRPNTTQIETGHRQQVKHLSIS
jgi:hypothetical protein